MSDTGRTHIQPELVEAARRDPGSTRAKPIEFEVGGVHFVAYKRRCFVLRRDAVRRMKPGSRLLIHGKPPGAEWRVYVFDTASLVESLGKQMQTPSYLGGGLYAFTTPPERIERHRITATQ